MTEAYYFKGGALNGNNGKYYIRLFKGIRFKRY